VSTASRASTSFTFEGTHEETLAGPGGDISATHKQLVGRGVQNIRAEGGKILEHHVYFDQVDVLTQLGLMLAAAATAS
jgi:SnoaL-like polyketide cyclase